MLQYWLFKNKFPFYKQLDAMDCGPTCLQIISKFYKKDFPLFQLRQYCFITRQGVSFSALKEAAEKLGFKALPVEVEPKTSLRFLYNYLRSHKKKLAYFMPTEGT